VPATVLLLRRGGVALDLRQLARIAGAGGGGLAVALVLGGAVLGPACGLATYLALGFATGALSRRQLELTRSPDRLAPEP
jgi:hypothetical protein